jgi:endogenous inhibitor of DNA gyrase (YacG/DUF329 family)
MLQQDRRKCRACGYPVTHYEASDDYGYASGFTATYQNGRHATADNCPKCGAELTFKSTVRAREEGGATRG